MEQRIIRDISVNVKMNDTEVRMLDSLSETYAMSRSETVRYLIRERYKFSVGQLLED